MGGRKITIIRYAVLAAAVCFVIAGVLRGEHSMVLQKAVRVCLECVGIG